MPEMICLLKKSAQVPEGKIQEMILVDHHKFAGLESVVLQVAPQGMRFLRPVLDSGTAPKRIAQAKFCP